jgi:small basic protein
MWLPILGLLLGILLGLNTPILLAPFYARYLSVAILAALDSVFGGIKAGMEGNFNSEVFVSGFFGNMLLAAFLTYIGDRLGVELYYAALFAFGVRLFQNLGIIRRMLLGHYFGEARFEPDNKRDEF